MNKDDGNFILTMLLIIGGGFVFAQLIVMGVFRALQTNVAAGVLLIYGIILVAMAFSISNEHSFRRGDYKYLLAVYIPVAIASFYFLVPDASTLRKVALVAIYLVPIAAIIRAGIAQRKHEWY